MAILSGLGKLALNTSGMTKAEYKQRSVSSIQWFQNKVVGEFLFQSRNKDNKWAYDEVGNSKRKLGAIESTTSISIGSMYLYIYDAKHKKTLPYWDALPLVLPIQPYKDGFLGINFHYLSPKLRLILLNALITQEAVKDDEAYMNVSYKILNTIAKSKYFEPTIKRYLYSNIRSNFAKINPNEWEKAVMLPLSKFQGSSKSEVWKISAGE